LAATASNCTMAKPGSDRDGAMVEKQAGKKSKDKISPYPKTPKLDRSEFLGKEGKPKSSMKRKLSFTVSPPRNEERDYDTDKDGPDKKKVKKESGGKKSTPVNILFGYPLSERKQMALLMQMTARDNSPDSTPSHPSQTPTVQKKIASSSSSRQKDKVNKRNERGETPLHMAAIRGDVKQVKELIGLGADVNVKDFAGWTPLHEACNLGYYDVAKVLISAGAEVNTQGLDDDTPLHDASSSGHKDIVKLLLRHGGNAFQANKRGERPVDVADSPELEQVLKGEVPLSDAEDTSSESEDPPSVNPSSVDDNMEYSDGEKETDNKQAPVKASSSMSGLDEYEFKDEEEEEDLSKALNDRHILRREQKLKEKEDKERNNHTPSKQANKIDQTNSLCKSKKMKASRIIYCTSDSSSDEADLPSEKKMSPTHSAGTDGHKSESRTKKENQGLSGTDQKDKVKVKKKYKSQSKNKENQELREDGKENSKAILYTPATVSENADKGVREEDSFKMSFSPKDDSSVHLFHLSAVKSPKLNHSLSDKQSTTPLKQENAKTIGDGSCPVDGVKYNHYTDSSYESSSSKGCKHKEKSKHHQKELSLDGDDGSLSPFKDGNLGNSADGCSDGALRKTDKDGKVVKKHKLKHKEKDKYRKEYESEKNRHRQKEGRKDSNRNMEFDREFWKENFFKSDDNDDLAPAGKNDTAGGGSPQKISDSLLVKEEKVTKDKHSSSSSNSSKDKKSKEEREKDKALKKERKEIFSKEERVKECRNIENEDWVTDCLGPGRVLEESHHGVKEETEDKPVTGISTDQEYQEPSEKSTREKTDKKLSSKDREAEKADKKHTDKEKKFKTEHFPDRSELQNCTDRWKERERTNASHSPCDKNKESEKLRLMSTSKKHEENKKNKDRPERKSERDRPEKDPSVGEHRDKTGSDRKGKVSERTAEHNKVERTKEKECDRDTERKKKEKSKESSSSGLNLKLLLEDKKIYTSESSKVISKLKEDVKTPEKERDRRDRERDSDRHKERDRERHKDKEKERWQQSKVCKAKANDLESDRTKSKASPASRDARPKEKRLVNDDLMQTSFERMLSLKDQEIEQWHRKHLEKIKQKERERMKQRPVLDLGKQKSKEKSKIGSSSSSEPCLGKELIRSKSSEASESHIRDKPPKDATSGRTLSLDAKSMPSSGKMGAVLENSLSRSPRPESERSGIMSRSVSMISVASSEDSCQATLLTPRPTEYDSDFNLEASDSQPAFLQSSLTLQSSRSPVIHERDSGSLPEVVQSKTSLLSRHASPYLRAILDEDAESAPTEGKQSEDSQKTRTLSHPVEEHCKVQLLETSLVQVQDGQSTTVVAPQSSVPDAEILTSAESELTSSGGNVTSPTYSRDLYTKESAAPLTALTQGTATSSVPEPQPKSEPQSPHQDHSSGTESVEASSNDSKEPSPVVSSSAAPSQPQHLSNTKASSHLGSQQWDSNSDPSIEPAHRTYSTLTEHKEHLSIEGPDDRSSEKISELMFVTGSMDLMSILVPTSAPKPSNEEPVVNSIKASPETKDLQQTLDNSDVPTGPQTESLGSDGLSEQIECGLSSLPVTESLCNSPENKLVEPMEVMEGSDMNSANEMVSDEMSAASETGLSIPETQVGQGTGQEIVQTAEDKPTLESKTDSIADVLEQSQTNSGIDKEQVVSGNLSPLNAVDQDSDHTRGKAKVLTSDEDVDIHVHHPRKRKMPKISTPPHATLTAQQVKERTQQSLAAIVDSLKLEEIQPYQTERANPYYEFLHIRKKIEEKRKVLCSVIPQAPQYYDEYVTFNGSYLLDGNPLSKLCIPTITPPPSLPEPLKEMFKQQEVVRMKLRLQHSIEREKLIVSNEQEVLRVHYRAARTLANQALPFSACTVLLDAEVYNMPQDVQGDDGKTSVRDRFNARQFMSWLQDVDDKFDKLKTCLLMRQQHEAAALNAVQRLEWQLKLQELEPATYKSTSIFEIPEFYIPLVEVNDDFDLTPI
uniref:Ankyrin repeat domain 12 n=2 Tax=Denticeps clupeoides TaxID=299321 RepID=A0AAY4B7K0_9TELE